MSTKLVVGLGNPGPEYEDTRHNVGFRIVDRLARTLDASVDAVRFEGRFGRARLGSLDVALLEPQTYMNRSGAAVRAALAGLLLEDPAEDLIVVYDDLDLPLGRLRLRPGGGAGGHRGLQNVLDILGTTDVPRLRFGIGRPPPGGDPVEYVLSPFSEAERRHLEDRVREASAALESALRGGVRQAMNHVNRAPEATDSEPTS